MKGHGAFKKQTLVDSPKLRVEAIVSDRIKFCVVVGSADGAALPSVGDFFSVQKLIYKRDYPAAYAHEWCFI